MKPVTCGQRRTQRGAAALVVALVLVFGMALVLVFANRGMLFEQRSSANQYRATLAFELAEAGLEWAVARLNDDLFINSKCASSGAAVTVADPVTNSFRQRYLAPTVDTAGARFVIASPARASCGVPNSGIDANGVPVPGEVNDCSCPASGTNPTLGSASGPRFTVEFRCHQGPDGNPVTCDGDPLTVEIVSFGCTNSGAPCDPGSTATPDGTAVVRSLFKVRPKFPNSPGAGLIAGSAATLNTGTLHVINLDVESNGITINSGTSIALDASVDVTTLPGTPRSASVLDNDFALQQLTLADTEGNLFFQSFFGESVAEYKANPQTWLITGGSCGANTRCVSANSDIGRGTAAMALFNKGITQFWADQPVVFNNSNMPVGSTFGTPERPISFAGSSSLELKGGVTAYGMFYVATATADIDWNFTGAGSAKVYGSFVSRGNFLHASGSLDLIYDGNIFRKGEATGLMVRVPGSWRDKLEPY